MTRIHRWEFQVPATALDANGHVNNVEFVRWMQEVAILHWEAAGCSRATLEINATWVVRSHQVEYRRPAYAGDWLTVLTWITNFRRVSSLRKYRFIRLPDSTLLACGQTDWVFVDAGTGRPRAIPEFVREAFELVPEGQEPC